MNKFFLDRIKVYILFTYIVFISILPQTGCGGSSPDIAKLKSEIIIQVDEMQNTLNSNDYSKFIRDFVDPFYVTKYGGLDQMLLDFNSTTQVEIFTALELAKNVEPLYSSTRQIMTYVGGSLTTPLTFQKIEGKWYLSGESLNLNLR